MLKNGPFLSIRQFKKRCLSSKKSVFSIFLYRTLFAKNRLFATWPFFLIADNNNKRSIFEESYILYGKRQKSCTLIVI